MSSRQRFSPLCDVHHVLMPAVVHEEDSEEVRTYHECQRRDCNRIFRDSNGYSDRTDGEFDEFRSSFRKCPQCGSALYLAEVERSRKTETWECSQKECDFCE